MRFDIFRTLSIRSILHTSSLTSRSIVAKSAQFKMAWVHCPPPGGGGQQPGRCWQMGSQTAATARPLSAASSAAAQLCKYFFCAGSCSCVWGLEARLIKQQQPRNKAKCANVASRQMSRACSFCTQQCYTGLKKLFANELLLLLL